MNTLQLGLLCERIIGPIIEIGDYILERQRELSSISVTSKSLNSLVSEVDIEAERKLVALLKSQLPEAGYLTEEETIAQSESELRWIIDPLDGTTNFLHGLPHFAISIALEIKNELVLGIVYDCAKKDCFSAWRGGGAWFNGLPINVSKASTLDQSLLATGFPYYDFDKMAGYLDLLEYFMRNTRGIRRFGSASLDLAWVACARFDGFFEYGLNLWDVAAGIVLIREAGGQVTDFSGGAVAGNGNQIVGSNGLLQQFMLDQISIRLLP